MKELILESVRYQTLSSTLATWNCMKTGRLVLPCSSSVTQSCLTLCRPMDWSTPGFPVLHYLAEFVQTHIHWVDDAIQPSHPLRPLLLLPSIFPRIRVFSSEWLFTSGGQTVGASPFTSVLPVNIQGWFHFELTGLISLQSTGLSRVFSNTTFQKYQFFSAQPSLWFNSLPCMTTGKANLWLYRPLLAEWYLFFSICCLGLS